VKTGFKPLLSKRNLYRCNKDAAAFREARRAAHSAARELLHQQPHLHGGHTEPNYGSTTSSTAAGAGGNYHNPANYNTPANYNNTTASYNTSAPASDVRDGLSRERAGYPVQSRPTVATNGAVISADLHSKVGLYTFDNPVVPYL
jgi:hypothetical protein